MRDNATGSKAVDAGCVFLSAIHLALHRKTYIPWICNTLRMFFLPREAIDRLHDIKGRQVEARSSKPASWQAVSPARFAAASFRAQASMAATGTAFVAERLLDDEARCRSLDVAGRDSAASVDATRDESHLPRILRGASVCRCMRSIYRRTSPIFSLVVLRI